MFVHPSLSVAAEADWLRAQGGEPVTKKPRNTPERDFQENQVSHLRAVLPPGAVVFAVTNEHAAKARTPGARAQFYAMRRAQGVAEGFPDIGIALPAGRVVWVENKSRRGTLSAAQRAMHATLRALGHTVIVARDIAGTRAGLIAAGVPLADAANEPAKIDTPPRMVRARLGKRTVLIPADRVRA